MVLKAVAIFVLAIVVVVGAMEPGIEEKPSLVPIKLGNYDKSLSPVLLL